MLLYIVYYGPRQLGKQAYFNGVRGGGGGGGSFSSIMTIEKEKKNHKKKNP